MKHEIYKSWKLAHDCRNGFTACSFFPDSAYFNIDERPEVVIEPTIGLAGRDEFTRICRIYWLVSSYKMSLWQRIKTIIFNMHASNSDPDRIVNAQERDLSYRIYIVGRIPKGKILIIEKDNNKYLTLAAIEPTLLASRLLNLRSLKKCRDALGVVIADELEAIAIKLQAANDIEQIEKEAERLTKLAEKYPNEVQVILSLDRRRRVAEATERACVSLMTRVIENYGSLILSIPGGFAVRSSNMEYQGNIESHYFFVRKIHAPIVSEFTLTTTIQRDEHGN